MSESLSGYGWEKVAFPLSYGSADLQGFKYQDTVCLGPINKTNMDDVSGKLLKTNFCIKDFKL